MMAGARWEGLNDVTPFPFISQAAAIRPHRPIYHRRAFHVLANPRSLAYVITRKAILTHYHFECTHTHIVWYLWISLREKSDTQTNIWKELLNFTKTISLSQIFLKILLDFVKVNSCVYCFCLSFHYVLFYLVYYILFWFIYFCICNFMSIWYCQWTIQYYEDISMRAHSRCERATYNATQRGDKGLILAAVEHPCIMGS